MRITRRELLGALAGVAVIAPGIATARDAAPPPGPRPLQPGAFADLVAARRGQPFLLVLWSITCVPCREEFALLRDMRAQHPGLPLVLVSTDDLADAGLAARALRDFGMDREESWIFAADAQALRYEIDPAWYGELPRAYFYDAAHRREGVSGQLPRSRIEQWLGGPAAGG